MEKVKFPSNEINISFGLLGMKWHKHLRNRMNTRQLFQPSTGDFNGKNFLHDSNEWTISGKVKRGN